jgi:hypothetical protein
VSLLNRNDALLQCSRPKSFLDTPYCNWQTISAMRHECRADLIVMTTRSHHGFLDALSGSTTERIVHNSTCPVLALPAYGNEQALLQEAPVWRPAV